MRLLFLLTLGCQVEPVEVLPAHPYELETQPDEIDLEQLSEDIQAALQWVPELSPYSVIEAYDHAMQYSTADCPQIVETETSEGVQMTFWESGCETVSQFTGQPVFFNGPMTTWDWNETLLVPGEQQLLYNYGLPWPEIEFETASWTGSGMNGQTDIYSEELDFNCSCLAHSAYGETEKDELWMRIADGPSHSTGAALEGAWINENLQVGLSVYARRSKLAGRRFAWGQLEISGHGSLYNTVSIEYSLQSNKSDSCALHLEEQYPLSIRARESHTGRWLTLDWTLDPDSCTACTQHNEESVCVELGPLVNWETEPW